MIHTRHNRGVIFAGGGWRGVLHRWRMWRNDKLKRKIKEDYERYRNGFLDNQNEIDTHWDEDIPEPKKEPKQDKHINWNVKNPILEHVFWEW